MAERNIKFRYFGVVRQRKNGHHWQGVGSLDFDEWMGKIEDAGLLRAIIELPDTKAQIERVAYYENDNIWGLHLLKLREDNLPSIAGENRDAECVPLGDDEYIGEDLFMLYDNANGICMVQINRFSLGIKRLQELLSYVWNVENERVVLKPIAENVNDRFRDRRECKSIEVSFANLDRELGDEGNSLGRIMNSYRRFNGVAGYIKIGLGRKRNTTLNLNEVNEFINDARNEASVVGMKLKVKDDDDSPVEVIDLFENICNSVIPFNIERKTVLQFEYAVQRMLECYRRRREQLVELIMPER